MVYQKVERLSFAAVVDDVKFHLSTKLVGFIILMFVTQWDESLEDSSHVSHNDPRTSHL